MLKERKIIKKIISNIRRNQVTKITGPVQAGKSTLAKLINEKGFNGEYINADDFGSLKKLFSGEQVDNVILDEVEMIKGSKERVNNTGKMLSILSRKEEGSIEILPMSVGELMGFNETFAIDLFSDKITGKNSNNHDIYEFIQKGGFAEPHRFWDDELRTQWFEAYISNLLLNIKNISNIDRTVIPTLITLLAHFAASRLNMLDLSRLSDIPNTTLRRYIDVLEKIYLIKRLKPIEIRGVIRSDRLLFTDSGVLCHLLGLNDKNKIKTSILHRNILKNFVTMEIIKQLSWESEQPEIFFYSTPSGADVDIIVKKGGLFAGIAINPGVKISNRILKGFEDVKKETGSRFVKGIILYYDKYPQLVDNDIFALPIDHLWAG